MKQLLLLGIGILCLTEWGNAQSGTKAGITLSLPWANHYVFADYELGKSSSKGGFFGIGAALFYKTAKYKLSLNGGITGDLPAPMGPVDFGKEGTRSQVSAFFGEALYHRPVIGRFSAVGGINFTDYRYQLISYEDTIAGFTEMDPTIGLTFGTAYQFSKNFSLAFFYRPALVSFDNRQYRHLLSLDARFDITIWKR